MMNLYGKKGKIARNTFRCAVDWDSMVGDGSVRHCHQCNHNVYDLRGLTEDEVVQFIELHEGNVCGLAHYNWSGRIVNGKCTQASPPLMGRIRSIEPGSLEAIEIEIEQAKQRIHDLKLLAKLVANKLKS